MALFASLTGVLGDTTVATVYLRRCTPGDDLIGQQDGYTQKIAELRPDGTFADVEETWKLMFTSNTDADRVDTLQDLGKLRLLAFRIRNEPTLDAAMWLQVQTATENNARYGVVKDAVIPQLDERHYRSNVLPKLELTITRAGLWDEVSPLATSWPRSVSGGTLENRDYTGGYYSFSIPGASQGGDAPGLMSLVVSVWYFGGTFLINYRFGVKRFEDSDAYNRFNPHFNIVNENSGLNQVVDSGAPGGYQYIYTSGASAVQTVKDLEWDLPGSATIKDYAGTHLVYAAVYSTISSAEMAFLYNGEQITSYIPVPSPPSGGGSKYSEMFVGIISLPPDGALLHTLTPGAGTLGLRINIDAAAYESFQILHWWLVPVTDGYTGARRIENNTGGAYRYLSLDGWQRQAYIQESGGTLAAERVELDGVFINTYPGVVMGIYPFVSKYTDADGNYLEKDTLRSTLTAKLINRYQTLRD